MRLLILCFLALLTSFSVSAQTPATPAAATSAAAWTADLAAALQQAKATNKPVLAVFSGSDWCKPCIMLKQEVLDQAAFEVYAKDRFVLARFDFPRNKKNKLPADQMKLNEQAASQLNKDGVFPLVVVLSPDGKVLARTGYRAGGAAAYNAHLTELLATK